MSESVLPVFSSRSFIVSGLTFRSLALYLNYLFSTPPRCFVLNSCLAYRTSLISEFCVSNWPISYLLSESKVKYLFFHFDFFFFCPLYTEFFLKDFYCCIVDLQYCVNFRSTAKWISYTYTYIHSFSDSFPM